MLLDRFGETGKGTIVVIGMKAIIEEFQEVRLTRTEITVNPNAVMRCLTVSDGRKHIVYVVYNFISEYILVNFNVDGVSFEIRSIDSRIERTINLLFG